VAREEIGNLFCYLNNSIYKVKTWEQFDILRNRMSKYSWKIIARKKVVVRKIGEVGRVTLYILALVRVALSGG
jgi:hypothetical protein